MQIQYYYVDKRGSFGVFCKLFFSWLLKDKNMKIRSMYPPYIAAVKRYFKALFKELKTFQVCFYYSDRIRIRTCVYSEGVDSFSVKILSDFSYWEMHGVFYKQLIPMFFGGTIKWNICDFNSTDDRKYVP